MRPTKNLTHKNWIRSSARLALPCPAQQHCKPFVQDDFLLAYFLSWLPHKRAISATKQPKTISFSFLLLACLSLLRVCLLDEWRKLSSTSIFLLPASSAFPNRTGVPKSTSPSIKGIHLLPIYLFTYLYFLFFTRWKTHASHLHRTPGQKLHPNQTTKNFPETQKKKIHTESILVPLFILCVYFYTTFPGLVKQPNEGG